MADVSMAADALVQTISATLYPNGTGAASITGTDVIVYQGWPNPQTLDADLGAGKSHVSVFPRPNDRVTTVMMGDTEWDELSNDGTQGVAAREVRRASRQMQITIWAPTPTLRDQIAARVDAALAVTTRATLADGSAAVITYVNSAQRDEQQKMLIYRRDLFYDVNYALVQTVAAYTIKHTVTDVTTGPTDTASGPTVTITSPRS